MAVKAEVGILIYPGVQMSAVLAMTDLFIVSNRFSAPRIAQGQDRIAVSHWRIETEDGPPRRVHETHPPTQTGPDVLILPPSLDSPATAAIAAPYLDWLRDRHAAGTILASVCAGAFLLGETGLLDGRPTTTHWFLEDQFRARFPHVPVDVDRLLIDGGQILTAGGVMSWTDLCLRLVERLRGAEVMTQTARFLLVDPPGREQRYYRIFSPRTGHGDAAVLAVQRWLQDTEARDISLERLAAKAGLERRTFLRRFRAATGMTTSEYGQRLRVGRACELLQFSAKTVEQIAWEVGYADPGAFRKIFARFIGLTPGEYRRRFGHAS
ncbi:GlxA family transcriptional regulator [Pontibaca methylaminivorans]|uniref:Transcriptional regulator, AraC family with amidase-like domain n=1 Tax=Pontibaca methylaminivorans TaxID=515897 RepID=A0A1R3WMF5_9RHOB|nr:GlxA family transcriptional regulator [Pontibaca methylaminivorans]SIT79391.1 transcriptional regulator, AraC family with amidase-like domain [Pontibaca methylaminivorans]